MIISRYYPPVHSQTSLIFNEHKMNRVISIYRFHTSEPSPRNSLSIFYPLRNGAPPAPERIDEKPLESKERSEQGDH